MTVLWIVLAGFIVACALGVVVSRSPITSAISLLVGFIGVAVLYLCLKAEFVAAVQVLVYAGGVMVLYIIGIMFSDSRVLHLQRQVHLQAWPAFVLVLVLFLWMGHRLYHADYLPEAHAATAASMAASQTPAAGAESAEAPARPAADNTRQVARVLYGDYLYPFEAASVLLLVAMLGAVFLAKKEI
jgi:NADH-quinone oxidoreductase subunit J